MRWSLNSSPSRTIVWPALLPPWKRATTSAFSASRSVILPLPSSPHWAPTTTVPGTLPSVQDASRGDDAGRRGLDQASRDAGAVADGVQVLDGRLQACVQLGSSRVELDLDAVQQRVAPVHAGREVVHGLEHVEDVCLLYTSDAADEEDSVDLGGRRIIKKKKKKKKIKNRAA